MSCLDGSEPPQIEFVNSNMEIDCQLVSQFQFAFSKTQSYQTPSNPLFRIYIKQKYKQFSKIVAHELCPGLASVPVVLFVYFQWFQFVLFFWILLTTYVNSLDAFPNVIHFFLPKLSKRYTVRII